MNVAKVILEFRGQPIHYPAITAYGFQKRYEFRFDKERGTHTRVYAEKPAEGEFPMALARQELEDVQCAPDHPFGQLFFALVTVEEAKQQAEARIAAAEEAAEAEAERQRQLEAARNAAEEAGRKARALATREIDVWQGTEDSLAGAESEVGGRESDASEDASEGSTPADESTGEAPALVAKQVPKALTAKKPKKALDSLAAKLGGGK